MNKRINEIRKDFEIAKDVCEIVENRAATQSYRLDYNEFLCLELAVKDIPYLLGEIERLQTQISEYQDVTRETHEITGALRACNKPKGHRCSECPVFSRYEHRICKATVDRLAADMIESLQFKLAESQRREAAAVEEVCRRCPDGEVVDGLKYYSCNECKWRGSQEEGHDEG